MKYLQFIIFSALFWFDLFINFFNFSLWLLENQVQLRCSGENIACQSSFRFSQSAQSLPIILTRKSSRNLKSSRLLKISKTKHGNFRTYTSILVDSFTLGRVRNRLVAWQQRNPANGQLQRQKCTLWTTSGSTFLVALHVNQSVPLLSSEES